ncbi:RNA polymerase sigma factor [Mucilaginibacter robiniae]|uniref:RNA polymerase sigma factor n=1 Tax=Mucilaginibacter robiniae TaxID=2728022 RepID=A0A7L5E1S7_9SPHI|nr:RNA polymerase sigma factor [Mucilaginibacter robiniae]QJD94783.1 RNA polymerase sigma factor [Mucilaginibacter robiniae]
MHAPISNAEAELIRHCKTGNLRHQEILYKQYYGYAMGISLRYSINRDDTLEAVNDAFIKIFNMLHTYDAERPFKAWIRRIIVNTAIDRRRKDLKFQLHTTIDDAVQVSFTDTTIASLNAKNILELLDKLPPLQRAIFNLYEIDGYNHDEIAVLLSVPASSCRVYLSRAKEKLRKLLTAEA